MEISCLICSSTDCHARHWVAGYTVYACIQCGFQFVFPTPEKAELAEYYSQQYAVPFERYAMHQERNTARIIDLERWQARRGHLLEIGASYGHSLAIAQQRGWHVRGVELSPEAAAYAQHVFGIDIWNGDTLDAPFTPQSFDAIMMWHVLEHTQNPKAQLQHVYALLKPGGVLGIRVPNSISMGARLAGRSWSWLCPPAHLWYFSPKTLTRLLRQLSFDILEAHSLRGDGNNVYQHALIAAGGRLNALRRLIMRPQASAIPQLASGVDATAIRPSSAELVQRWTRLLQRVQPWTERFDRVTRPLIGPLEDSVWGDELLVYARRATL